MQLISLGVEGLKSSTGLIGPCAAVTYLFGAEGYGECRERINISCWYFCNFLQFIEAWIYLHILSICL